MKWGSMVMHYKQGLYHYALTTEVALLCIKNISMDDALRTRELNFYTCDSMFVLWLCIKIRVSMMIIQMGRGNTGQSTLIYENIFLK